MINLLIADDEPLVQSGIKSMLNWMDYGVNIVGTAMNGAAAYDMIKRYSPEIVITDIKMPIKSGLELVKLCHEEGMSLPVFIILTSYEDFHFVKEALTYQVVDYLIKLELTEEILGGAIKRALKKISQINNTADFSNSSISSIYLLKEQFYTRLILNLFESQHQFELQSHNLNLNFNYDAFVACYIGIDSKKLSEMTSEKQFNLYMNSLQMTQELIAKYIPSHVLSLDMKHFAIIFFLSESNAGDYRNIIYKALRQISDMLYNYYSVTMSAGIGVPVTDLVQVSTSFQEAKQSFVQINDEHPILFAEDYLNEKAPNNVFNMSLFKEDIRMAYAEFNEKALYDIFTSIMELFKNQPAHYMQALDAAGNILYLSLSLLSNGEQIVSGIFKSKNNGYRSLYELSNVEQILEWLTQLRDGLCKSFVIHNQDYKNYIVANVKKYINENLNKKLTLNKTAEVFNISPNYLSILFSKYNDIGFTDYISHCKIEAAKKMIADGSLKIYEISDILGFESAFYFSRVFKKVTGFSPRDYMNQFL